MLLKTNEEMGEVGLEARQASKIEPISILAPGYADAHEQFGWNYWITYVYIYFATLIACIAASVVNMLQGWMVVSDDPAN